MTVAGCTFSHNTALMTSNAQASGGGLHVSFASLVVTNSSFVSNRVLTMQSSSWVGVAYGGGLYYEGYLLRLTGVLVSSNAIGRATSTAGYLSETYGGGKPSMCIQTLGSLNMHRVVGRGGEDVVVRVV
jgi:hypothetical protein